MCNNSKLYTENNNIKNSAFMALLYFLPWDTTVSS